MNLEQQTINKVEAKYKYLTCKKLTKKKNQFWWSLAHFLCINFNKLSKELLINKQLCVFM